MWPGIRDTYQNLPESDSGSFRYTRSRDYQTPTRHAQLGSGRCWKTNLKIQLQDENLKRKLVFWNIYLIYSVWYILFPSIDGRLFEELNVCRWTVNSGSKDVCWERVDVDLLYFDVNAELILLVYVLPSHIFFIDTFWENSAVFLQTDCQLQSQQTFVKGKSVQAYFRCFYISLRGI